MNHTNIRVYGTHWCSDCKRAKRFFGEQRVHYDFVDVDGDADGMAYVEQANGGKQIIPVILFEDGSTLVEPSNAELAAKLGLRTVAKNRFYDLIVRRSRRRPRPVRAPWWRSVSGCDGAAHRWRHSRAWLHEP